LENSQTLTTPARILNANNPETNQITIYTDGSCENNGDRNARAGCGIWFGAGDPRNKSIQVGEDLPQSNNVAEILAVYNAAKLVPAEANIHFKTDSKWTIDSLTTNLNSNTDNGYIGVQHGNLIRATAALLQQRLGGTTFEWVKGHSGIEGNEGADTLAAQGAAQGPLTTSGVQIPKDFELTGAKLAKASQALLYKGICTKKDIKAGNRTDTLEMLEEAREGAHELSGQLLTDARIWLSVAKNCNLSRNVQSFLWKALHKGHKCGD
jgi:ribonuclease HI